MNKTRKYWHHKRTKANQSRIVGERGRWIIERSSDILLNSTNHRIVCHVILADVSINILSMTHEYASTDNSIIFISSF